MNRAALTILALMGLLITTASDVCAQPQPQQPPPDQQPDMQGRGGRGGPGRFGGPDGGRGGFGGGGGMGGNQGMPGGRGGAGPELAKFEILRSYIDTVDRMTKMASDPAASGVAAVVSATDLLRQRGPEAAITYLTKTLPDVKNVAVQRAIRIQLADLYKQAGQSDKALEQLDILMKTAP